MVRKPRGVDGAARRVTERREDAPLQRDPACRRHCVLDRRTGELVAEGDGISVSDDEPRRDARVQVT